MFLLGTAERPAGFDPVPLFEAGAAAGSGRVLGDEHRVAAHRRLAAVIQWLCGCEALCDEIPGMIEHCREPALGKIGALLRVQPKAAPEGGGSQSVEDEIEIAHPSNVGLSTRFVSAASSWAW